MLGNAKEWVPFTLFSGSLMLFWASGMGIVIMLFGLSVYLLDRHSKI
jgi:choline-glycine betaine transporter